MSGEVKIGGKSEFAIASNGDGVPPGRRVKTGADGRAELSYDDGSRLRLSPARSCRSSTAATRRACI